MLPSLLLLATAALAAPAPESPHVKRGAGITVPMRSKPNFPAKLPVANSFAAQEGESTAPIKAGERQLHYYVTLDIGTPPQSLDFVLDTGSSDLVVYSSLCPEDQCKFTPGNKPFDPTNSSTFTWDERFGNISTGYGGGERNYGRAGSDRVGLGGVLVNDFTFSVVEGGNMGNRSDGFLSGSGILGMSFANASEFGQRPLGDYISGEGASHEFGIYLGRPEPNEWLQGSTLTGEITFGGIDEAKIDGPMNYVPVLDDGGMSKWLIELDAVHLGDVALRVGQKEIPMKDSDSGLYDPFTSPNNIALVDTGAPVFIVPADVFVAFHEAIPGSKEYKSPGESSVYSVPCNAPNLNLTFTIGGIDYPLYWGDLIYAVDETNSECATLVYTRPVGTNTYGWILGTPFLNNVYTSYRYSPNEAVGFTHLKPEFNKQSNQVNSVVGANSTEIPEPITEPDPSPGGTNPQGNPGNNNNNNNNNNNSNNNNNAGTQPGSGASPRLVSVVGLLSAAVGSLILM